MRRFLSVTGALAVLVLTASVADARGGFGGGGGGGAGGARGKKGTRASAQDREVVARAVRRDNLRRGRMDLA
jgi:hypothetical protein